MKASEAGFNLDHACFVCGRANRSGLRIDFDVSAEGADARFVFREEHQSYDGVVHGGLVTALLDEAMGWALVFHGVWSMTARLELSFRRPVGVGDTVRVTGRLVRDRGRRLEVEAEIRRATDDELLVSAVGTCLRMPTDLWERLVARYGDPSPAVARLRAAASSSS